MSNEKYKGHVITTEQALACLANQEAAESKGLMVIFKAAFIDGRALMEAMQKYDAYNLEERPIINEKGQADGLFILRDDNDAVKAYFNGIDWCPPFC